MTLNFVSLFDFVMWHLIGLQLEDLHDLHDSLVSQSVNKNLIGGGISVNISHCLAAVVMLISGVNQGGILI